MSKRLFALCAMLFVMTGAVFSQAGEGYSPGVFGLGMRSSLNFFPAFKPDDESAMGMGAGGMWRLAFAKRVNTEWFFDLIHSSASSGNYRKDYHIGWSVQFALPKRGFGGNVPTPYILGGQCFDLTQVGLASGGSMTKPVFSAATQAGLGLSQYLTRRFELNAQAQYMIHLTRDVHVEYSEATGEYEISDNKGPSIGGHVLLTLSMSYYFADLF